MRVVVEREAGRRVVTERGPGVDLRGSEIGVDLDAATVVAAACGDEVEVDADVGRLRIDCPEPGAGYRTLARPSGGDGSRRGSARALLAAVARSRGAVAPERAELEAARSALRDLDPEPDPVDLRAARRRVAEAGSRETELEERAAALRGRLDALRERDAPAEAVERVESERRTVVARLSEAETERIAAEQALDRARRAARSRRTARERRLRLEDRVANLERRARESLADSGPIRAEFVAAVERLTTRAGEPGRSAPDADAAVVRDGGDGAGDRTDGSLPADSTPDGSPPDGEPPATLPTDADPANLRRAAIDVAALAAPVVLTDRRFGTPAEAARRLGTPVVWL